jgi:integrase
MSYFFLVTGARLREAAMLEWKEIDFNRKVVRFVLTKSWRAREVPLGNDMMAWLTEHRLKAGYVFGTTKGNPRINNVNRAMIGGSWGWLSEFVGFTVMTFRSVAKRSIVVHKVMK